MTELRENLVDGLLRLGPPPLLFALSGFPAVIGVREAGQHGSGRYLHTNSTIATEARFHIRDSGTFPF